MLRSAFSASTTTYAAHDIGPTWSVDLWTPGAAYGADNSGMTTMNNLAEWLKANRATVKLKYLIWRQRIFGYWSANWEGMENRGSLTANHMDHIHITFYDVLIGGNALTGITVKEEDPSTLGDLTDDIFGDEPSLSAGSIGLITVGSIIGVVLVVAVVVGLVVYKRRSTAVVPPVTVEFL
jgi:hypothetical protein